ncbi:hypothetical protein BH11PSE2_BH11PSE2_01060 [soil metagenome]
MAGEATTGNLNLTGVWQGLYTYPWGDEEGFVATLIHTGGTISGSTHEKDGLGMATSPVLYALVEGHCEAEMVTFRKTYDGTGGWTHSVFYDGALSSDGAEIEGRWHIPGDSDGRFLMIRQTGRDEAVTRKTTVTA